MAEPYALHPDRLLPADPGTRAIARELYASVAGLPIVSPHGHTDPAWYAENAAFPDPASLFVIPDHYVHRMLYSQGIRPERVGVPRLDGGPVETDKRKIWRILAENFHLYRGTPSWIWLNHAFQTVFGIDERLSADSADRIYDKIAAALERPEFRPRALFERFNIEVISTTESPLDDLRHHAAIRASDWSGRVVTAFRPDPVVDPAFPGFTANLDTLGRITGEDTGSYAGYLSALVKRRKYFVEVGGCTSTDHGHPTAKTADLSAEDAAALYARVRSGAATPAEAELFRAQMLTEMAAMSVVDGLVMQIHPGSRRDHNPEIFATFGKDKGCDIPGPTDYVEDLKPLLARFGNRPDLTIILFTLDETVYSRELAPLAGHYPALKLGPAWWFHDSPEGMRRYREQVTETAGFYNTVGFNDDTRAFLSIPAR
ncbi:glucuronate isomerase, partial [Siculibacillus lacustris]